MKKVLKIALTVLASIVGLFILIMLIPTNDDTETNTPPVKEESPTKEESPAKEESVVETQTMSKEEFTSMNEQMLTEAYGDNYYTEWNDNTYTVNIWTEGLSEATAFTKLSGDEELLNGWNIGVVDTTCSLSTALKESASANGLNIDVNVNVLNDTNLDNVLLTVLNGDVLYDVLN